MLIMIKMEELIFSVPLSLRTKILSKIILLSSSFHFFKASYSLSSKHKIKILKVLSNIIELLNQINHLISIFKISKTIYLKLTLL